MRYVIPHLVALSLGTVMVLTSSRGESMFTYGWVLIGGSVLFSLIYLAMIRRGHFAGHRGGDR
ncbi:hypothetical protein [Ornithinimicrobium pratense]|uniref:Uncharacterized protein n=1 Tax=Ornithinimicrobium pratense TaxID=2593973 RepID=A0A5J6V525_9MICO|nr:hypothetical protein [Ornithinimicrobium pratense]QFG68404.1 hypothetical protein FY030_06470 [Ornithinimicrobium pratense]